jgi:hypothetical protein
MATEDPTSRTLRDAETRLETLERPSPVAAAKLITTAPVTETAAERAINERKDLYARRRCPSGMT